MKTPGDQEIAGPLQIRVVRTVASDDAEHDGSDEGERSISGHNAQSVDESHGRTPLDHVTARI
jgi:hypothetical protein